MNEVLTVRTNQSVSGLALDRAVLHAQYEDHPGVGFVTVRRYDRFGLPYRDDGPPDAITIMVRKMATSEALAAIIFDRAGLR